jgi:hypothetical protein
MSVGGQTYLNHSEGFFNDNFFQWEEEMKNKKNEEKQ